MKFGEGGGAAIRLSSPHSGLCSPDPEPLGVIYTGPTGLPGFSLSSLPQFIEHLIKEQRCSLRLAPPVAK